MQFCHTSAVKKLLRHSNEFKGTYIVCKAIKNGNQYVGRLYLPRNNESETVCKQTHQKTID
jgi:hypothetical protein